jgi:hypothetical protein
MLVTIEGAFRNAQLEHYTGDFEENCPVLAVDLGEEHYQHVLSLHRGGARNVGWLSLWWGSQIKRLGLEEEQELYVLFTRTINGESVRSVRRHFYREEGVGQWQANRSQPRLIPCTNFGRRMILR